MSDIKRLSDHQVEAFDTEYIGDQLWERVRILFEPLLQRPDAHVLDVGGGNGAFCDKLLGLYPNLRCTLIDNSQPLLDRNKPDPRKRTLLASVSDLPEIVAGERYDLAFINWVLHHCVVNGFQATRAVQVDVMRQVRTVLKPDGRLAVFENIVEGVLSDRLCSQMVFGISSSTLLAPLSRKFGVNTAGVGVLYLGENDWRTSIQQAGYQVETYLPHEPWRKSKVKMLALAMKSIRKGTFICRPV